MQNLKKLKKLFLDYPVILYLHLLVLDFFVYPYLLNILGIKAEKPFKAKLRNDYSKNKKIIRFLKAKLTSTNDGKIELQVLQGQESFRIKSFVQSNVWGLFKDGQSKFKKRRIN
ncbi:hypothetical protein N8Z16_00220 [bacterium]|nr:hypothetical protein [bacterium]